MSLINRLQKQLVKLWRGGAFHILVGSFLTKFVVFFGAIFLVRVLSKASYGVLTYIENIYGYIYLFAGMGLSNAILRYLILRKENKEKFGYYRYALTKGTIFNIVLVIVVSLFFLFYPHQNEFISAKWLLLLMFLTLPFQFLFDSNLLTYRAMFDNKRFAIIAFMTTLILIIVRFLGAVLYDLLGVVVTNVSLYLLFGFVLIVLSHRLYFKEIKPYKLLKAERKEVNDYSIQYMITNGIWAAFMLNDIFLLGFLTGNANVVADYKVAYVLPGVLSIVSSAVGIFVGPYFVKNEANNQWIWKNYNKTILVLGSLITPIVIFMFLYSNSIITIVYGAEYQSIVLIMRLLLIAATINSIFRFTTAHLLASMGQIKINKVVSIFGIILQIVLNIILIPEYGSVGAAFTSIVVYSLMALSLYIIFIKKYKLN